MCDDDTTVRNPLNPEKYKVDDRRWQLVAHTVYYFQPISSSIVVKMTNMYCISSLVGVISDMVMSGLLFVHHSHWVDPTVVSYCLTPHGIRFVKNLIASGVKFPVFRQSKENYIKLLRLRETQYLLDTRFAQERLAPATSKQDLCRCFLASLKSGDYRRFVNHLAEQCGEQDEVCALRSHPQLHDRNTEALYLQYIYYSVYKSATSPQF